MSALAVHRFALPTALFAMGLVVGVVLRPHLGRMLRRAPQTKEGPAPINPHLWASRSEQFAILDAAATGPCLVFLGDSLTDWINVEEFFRFDGGAVLNRGISGDTTRGVLARIRDSFPADAKVCFLLIGRNDLKAQAAPDQVAARTEEICAFLVERAGVEHVVLESLPPADRDMDPAVRRLNGLLREAAGRLKGTSFLDLYPLFMQEGARVEAMFSGAAHLSGAGAVRRLRAQIDHVRRTVPQFAESINLAVPSPSSR